jgi:hypothetical protein
MKFITTTLFVAGILPLFSAESRLTMQLARRD